MALKAPRHQDGRERAINMRPFDNAKNEVYPLEGVIAVTESLTLDPRSLIVRRNDIPQAKLSDENVVLLNALRGNYYSLDDTGVRIWEILETETTVTQLCERLTEEYNVAPDNCLSDTLKFCQKLHDENLIICLE